MKLFLFVLMARLRRDVYLIDLPIFDVRFMLTFVNSRYLGLVCVSNSSVHVRTSPLSPSLPSLPFLFFKESLIDPCTLSLQ